MFFSKNTEISKCCTYVVPKQKSRPIKSQLSVLEAGLEPARAQCSLDFKSNVSTNSTTRAIVSRKNPVLDPDSYRDGIGILSGKRDSDPRPRPWQGRALPTELFPHFQIDDNHQKFGGANVVLFLIYKCIFIFLFGKIFST